jgi:hypothetical protein
MTVSENSILFEANKEFTVEKRTLIIRRIRPLATTESPVTT